MIYLLRARITTNDTFVEESMSETPSFEDTCLENARCDDLKHGRSMKAERSVHDVDLLDDRCPPTGGTQHIMKCYSTFALAEDGGRHVHIHLP